MPVWLAVSQCMRGYLKINISEIEITGCHSNGGNDPSVYA